ncbi:MAG: hypothetical protein A3G39_00915 [Deltaproteobacteria bacterium RIFCSPLOWO2_12_FULL_43_16]|nr:MAG: hypothetical protein A3D30_03345 [Deltaproteobacteria bacterium RIFCSPHIGHO2_02_FULL_43_33]OGQ44242.1 MAG: hypothetical protein A3A85_06865 [Deltaproteobacteria bacterium RIFCSPLOWO2_01_FULL_42_9]OGQ61553.1 MAG: hypothetical protein A3G39_00915 [Deltaproteobacteria bacterium RIFCSPLOWO2_12_FULL_43_16]HBR18369.1 hypothetical protein [Deltaproteobacteria bacterium]
MFEIATILASLGLILATVSFISGLQALKSKGSADTKIHRFNGYLTLIIYLSLAILSMSGKDGIKIGSVSAWCGGLAIIAMKIWIVRSGRAYKYASWMGIILIIMWLIIIYTNIQLGSMSFLNL